MTAELEHPTWQSGVSALFAQPFWVPADRRTDVAAGWLKAMRGYGIDLSDYSSVQSYTVTIYEHLASRSMPLTADSTQLWPAGALEQLRAWIGDGCRRSPSDPINPQPLPPAPSPSPPVRLRRNVLDLNAAELAEYQAAVDRLGATSGEPDCQWQRAAYVHTDWCLHYQEAFLVWHRANLLWIEAMLGMPIPYWNFTSPDAAVDGAPGAGLPQPFKDLTYVHPASGETRPNPLRFAIAKDGCSKACANGGPGAGDDCRYVQRDPVLYTTGDDQRQQREAKLAQITHFQQQVAFALSWPVFSSPQGFPGYPWANITSFNPPPPDSDYPHRTDFDGLYEQPHDNFHGWVGPDMADNAYTAFEPVFLSYHANVDRIFETWRRANPESMFTSTFPLRPFVGPQAATVELAAPDAWVYTTIGDMARDCRALGYEYEAPPVPDSIGAPPQMHVTDNGAATTKPVDDARLYVLFPGTRCVFDTYLIDAFIDLPDPSPSDISGSHYAGRMTRLGMGVEDDKGRCIAHGSLVHCL